MTFLWPQMLWAVLAVPALGLLYLLWMRSRRRAPAGTAQLGRVMAALRPASPWRRHVPAALFLFAFLGLAVALARPAAFVSRAEQRSVVMLVVDASGSMREQDIVPNRLVAAQQAIREFIDQQPGNVEIGLVAFAAYAVVLQEPTWNRQALRDAVGNITTAPSTAMGAGMLAALQTLFRGTDAGYYFAPDLDSMLYWGVGDLSSIVLAGQEPVKPGSSRSTAIVVLSDGASNRGPNPLLVAQLAADLGVRVYTVGLGDPAHLPNSRNSRLDEPTLRSVAELTGAAYYPASSANALREVYRDLGGDLVRITEPTEVTALLSAFSGLLALLGGLLSLLWYNRLL